MTVLLNKTMQLESENEANQKIIIEKEKTLGDIGKQKARIQGEIDFANAVIEKKNKKKLNSNAN